MRVAYAFNVQRGVEEAEAEYDTPETIDYVAGLLEEFGHEVERLDATLRAFAFVERPASSRPEQDVVGAVVESALRHHATGAAS